MFVSKHTAHGTPKVIKHYTSTITLKYWSNVQSNGIKMKLHKHRHLKSYNDHLGDLWPCDQATGRGTGVTVLHYRIKTPQIELATH